MLNNSDISGVDPATAEFMETMTRLFNKASCIELEPVDVGHGVLLYTSEIHLIDMAGRFPDESMSKIALRLGITKGAVSQTIKKLEKKGYLERINAEEDYRSVRIKLTIRGMQAFEWHKAYHKKVNGRITKEISRIDKKEQKNLQKILLCLEMIFDDCPKIRTQVSREIGKRVHRVSFLHQT